LEKEDWKKKGEGHRQRLRQRFVEGGLERFSDEEVVEFLLTLGTPRKDVKQEAREALKQFKSLSGVLSAPREKLLEIKGIGPKKCALSEPRPSGCPKVSQGQGTGKILFRLLKGGFRLPLPCHA
jgi:hypothetical protein